jgi:predicted XRE-type DNA-binding protein
MSELDAIHESTGNVFADLDVPEPEEALAKAELARRIGSIIRHRRLNQAQAAALLGIDQPKVSALLRGKLAGFSTDRLLRFLNALDRDVEIVIKRKPHARKQAQIRIVVA